MIQLGCTGGEVRSHFGGGQEEMPIWLDGVSCTGQEQGLSLCPSNGWGKHACTHEMDVGVCCANGCGVPDDNQGQESGEGADGLVIGAEKETPEEKERKKAELEEKLHPTLPIRMKGCQGMCCRVEIEYQDDWGTVCDDNFKQHSAQVVCRQLKCAGGEVVRAFGGGEGTIWMDKVDCRGDEKALSKCEFRGWGKHECSHQHDVAVCCNDNCVAILKEKSGGSAM